MSEVADVRVVWDDGEAQYEVVDPSIADVLERVEALDGRRHTLMTVLAGDAQAAVGGSVFTGLVVYVSFDGLTFHQLTNGAGSSDRVPVVAGGQEGAYAARFVVDIETARPAITSFVEARALDPQLLWETDVSRSTAADVVDLALLQHLDELLASVPDAIEWAERSDNRVIWRGDAEISRRWVPAWAEGVGELYATCAAIDMADVGVGWFVHPAPAEPPGDPYVPLEIAGRGRCLPLGSDGGGAWFVVVDGGAVWRLPPSVLRDHVYEPSPAEPIGLVAPSVRAFVERLVDAAAATVADDD